MRTLSETLPAFKPDPVVVGAAGERELHTNVKKFAQVTPLASFSADDLAAMRRISPDAYQALLQYEQLCRNNNTLLEAKETELQRCIDVGQEVLGQVDQLQLQCVRLEGERDLAMARVKELQQAEETVPQLREELGRLGKELRERQRTYDEHVLKLKHELSGKERELLHLQEGGSSRGNIHVNLFASASRLADLHNELQNLANYAGCTLHARFESSPSAVCTTARLKPPVISADYNTEQDKATLEQWFLNSLEGAKVLTQNLSCTLHSLNERLQRGGEGSRSSHESKPVKDEVRELAEENKHLRQALLALREEVQALDTQTERLCEADSAQHAAQLLLMREQHEEERRITDMEIRTLRAELSRWRAEATANTSTGTRGSENTQAFGSDETMQRCEADRTQLAAEIERLEAALRDSRLKYEQLVDQYQFELQRHMLRADELTRATAEISALKEQLRQVDSSSVTSNVVSRITEGEQIHTVGLTKRAQNTGDSTLKQQERSGPAPQKTNDEECSVVPPYGYEEMEVELIQERENTQQLSATLTVVRKQLESLTACYEEQRRCVQEYLRQLPPLPRPQRERVTLLLRSCVKKAAVRFFTGLEQREGISIQTSQGSLSGGDVAGTSCDPLAPPSGGLHSSFPSPHTSPVPSRQQAGYYPQNQQEGMVKLGVAQVGSTYSSPRNGNLPVSAGCTVLQNSEAAAAFSTALARFLSDATDALVQQLLQPYERSMESLRQLYSMFDVQSPVSHGTPRARGMDRCSDSNTDCNGSLDNIDVSLDEDLVVDKLTSARQQHEGGSDDNVWVAVMGGVIDAFVDSSIHVFQKVHRSAVGLLQKHEEELKEAFRQQRAAYEEQMRRAAHKMETEEELTTQLQNSQTKLHAALRTASEAQAKCDETTSRYCELKSRVEHLEERLSSKQREWEVERQRWRDAVGELQEAHSTAQQKSSERSTQQQQLVDELQQSVHTLQIKLNEEAARVRRADANVESLQHVLRDAQSAYQAMQRTLSDEQERREAAEERVEGLSRELALLRSRTQAQQERLTELQEAERLNVRQLETESQKNEALLKLNRALEERLAEVEGDREPLRQQLQSLLLMKPQ
uniref:Uncharacterized protein n=1 Tax=Trypanosoma vivax (strain Y486) TaxID=1055687 RepID=G0U5R3_TRYVY|nr:conserved hypothetical protein, fragment [Trypanosoma vivax Y486]